MEVNLNETVVWIRELLYMNKTELLQAAQLEYPDDSKLKKSEILLFAFERKFNPKTRDPSSESRTFRSIKFGSHS